MEDVFFNLHATEWAEILRNYGLLIASFATIWIAYNGIESWKQQKIWESDRELSHDTILSLFKLGQTTMISRNVSFGLPPTELVKKLENSPSDFDSQLAKSVLKRIDQDLPKLEKCYDDFEACMTRATVLWDNQDILHTMNELLSMTLDLQSSMSTIQTALHKDVRIEHLLDNQKSALASETIEGNEGSEAFKIKYMASINSLRTQIAPYIGRPS